MEGPAPADGLRIRSFRRGWPDTVCPSADLRIHLAEHTYDCVHHHALWLRTLHYAGQAARRTGARLVISPRGMMSDWAWHHRRWKKRLANVLIHPGALARAHGWHATSEAEATDIRRRGFPQPTCVAANGVDAPASEEMARAHETWAQLCPPAAQRPVALFYSRFHPKKRLQELIDLWLDLSPKDWLLLVAGIPEAYSLAELQDGLRHRAAGERIAVVDARNRPPPYGLASLFLLPSHSENFGMVVAEAMAWGVPVLVTDTTPWAEVAAENVGWCVPWARYREALRAALAEPTERLEQRGARARDWVLRRFSWADAARRLGAFYGKLAESPP